MNFVTPIALLILMTVTAATPAHAQMEKYLATPVESTLDRGVAVIIKVLIQDIRSKQPVPGARISDARVNRSRDILVPASFPAYHEPSLEYGVYRFKADLSTVGDWTLSFRVRFANEDESLLAVTVKVVDPYMAPKPQVKRPKQKDLPPRGGRPGKMTGPERMKGPDLKFPPPNPKE